MPGMVVPRARMAGRRDSSTAALRPLFQVTRTTWVTWLLRPCYEPVAAGDHFLTAADLVPDRRVYEISPRRPARGCLNTPAVSTVGTRGNGSQTASPPPSTGVTGPRICSRNDLATDSDGVHWVLMKIQSRSQGQRRTLD